MCQGLDEDEVKRRKGPESEEARSSSSDNLCIFSILTMIATDKLVFWSALVCSPLQCRK